MSEETKAILDDWPTDNGRYLCSPSRPMPQGAEGRWAHTNIEVVGEDCGGLGDGGSYERCRCKDCGAIWWSTLPD